jgi:hypothetical protein
MSKESPMLRSQARFPFAAMLSGIVLASCAAPRVGPPGPFLPCNPGVCTIKVFVTDCRAASGGVHVDKPEIYVDRAREMRWEIATPGFQFAADGIAFAPPNSQFEPKHNPQPTVFRIHNKKTANGNFKYTVNVAGCTPHDPWVQNR